MSYSKNRFARAQQQQKDQFLFRHINERIAFGDQSLEPELERQIQERIAGGQVTMCPPSNRKTEAKRFRYISNP